MNEEEKKAVEYLKTRLYGNEGCKYIDVAQEDLRIFINLIDRLQKEKEERNKYILKSKIEKIIYPTPENPISIEIQSSKMYRKIEKLLENNYEKF